VGLLTVSESVEQLAEKVRAKLVLLNQGYDEPADLTDDFAALDALLARHQEALDLLTEAYPGDHPTNRWRSRVEKLGAWPR
jgi:hypothetical protein